jgi:quercetin dioxygenase-like cupin family protein
MRHRRAARRSVQAERRHPLQGSRKSDIALHTHSSAERIVLVAGELLVTYEGQAEARLTPGTYAYGSAGRPHAGRCASDGPCILVIAFEGPVDAIPAAAGNP